VEELDCDFPESVKMKGSQEEGLGVIDLHHAAAKALVRASKSFTQALVIAPKMGSSRRARSLTSMVAWRKVPLKGSG
jgi:hypothetical protein